MEAIVVLEKFFSAIRTDSRIGASHIAIYMALYTVWLDNGCISPLPIISGSIMELAKLSSTSTYHGRIRELADYGYIDYRPTYKKGRKTVVYLT